MTADQVPTAISNLSRSNATTNEPETPVGAALAQLRRRVGITGAALGKRTGMSQAKVSKIETGSVTPTASDVSRLAKALGASPPVIESLVQRAEHERDRMMDVRHGRHDPTSWQHDIAELETASRELRIFNPAALSGLMQTSEYARVVLSSANDVLGDGFGVGDAVSARIHRQAILDDTTKSFHFLMPETVLLNQLGPAEDMLAQLRRISDVAELPNTQVSIIPERVRWPFPPYHGFSLLDDRAVIIDLFNTVVISRGSADLRRYRHVFDGLTLRATQDIEPILSKHRKLYLALAAEQ